MGKNAEARSTTEAPCSVNQPRVKRYVPWRRRPTRRVQAVHVG